MACLSSIIEAVRAAERERWARFFEDAAEIDWATEDKGLVTPEWARGAKSSLVACARRMRANDAPDHAPGQVVPWETT